MTGTADAVGRYLAALNAHDPEAVAAAVAPTFVNEHTSVLGVTRVGRDAYADAVRDFLGRFHHLHYDAEDVIVDDDRAAVPYRLTFTTTGDDGRLHAVAIRGAFVFRVEDGLIAHRVDYWDSSDYQRQISG
jgi:ketosteroid isomerase-like protein